MEYGLIGEHLSHSFSKPIHETLTGKPYSLRELTPEELPDFLRKKEFKGINVTIPYKASVIPYLDYVSTEAEEMGAVNAIVNVGGQLSGFNTDVFGFLSMAKKAGIDMKGRKVLIIGAGGAARTAAYAARTSGASEVSFAVRTVREEGQLPLSSPGAFNDYEIVVNATPVGMFPDVGGCPLDLKQFHQLKGVMDCVYNPIRTNLVLDAQEMGVPACGGLVMLVEQARKAAELFHAISIPDAMTESVTESILSLKSNIVLFGMPASGKTTLGREFAASCDKEFIDTDQLIENKVSKTISEIFAESGELAFRELERNVIEAISCYQGVVISVGGGAVLDSRNVRNLKHNGRMVQVLRDMDLVVSCGDRPLMRSKEDMMKLQAARQAVYDAISDDSITNNTTVTEALAKLSSL